MKKAIAERMARNRAESDRLHQKKQELLNTCDGDIAKAKVAFKNWLAENKIKQTAHRSAIVHQVHELHAPQGRYRQWTLEEETLLRQEHERGLKPGTIAAHLHRSIFAVECRLFKLRLMSEAEFVSAAKRTQASTPWWKTNNGERVLVAAAEM